MSSDPLSFTDISLDDDDEDLPVPSLATGITNTGTVVTSDSPRFLRWMVHIGLLGDVPSSWQISFIQMQTSYEQYVCSHPYPTGEEEGTVEPTTTQLLDTTSSTTTDAAKSALPLDIDPLTALVQASESEEKRLAEMDLQYRKEKALRNRGKAAARLLPESEGYDEELATLQVIDKDLHRLANPHTDMAADAEKTRKEMLRQVLFCYHCRNSEPGYRQGMHEIASYLLFALETDTSGTVDPIYHIPLTYHLLTKVLHDMGPAFDVQTGNGGGASSSPSPAGSALQTISRRVDHMIRTHDPLLGQRLANLQVPPQMYFTKWIRLLFAREVSNVLDFWDQAFFGTEGDPNYTIMTLLEAWTAARLLVWSAHFMSIRDEGQLLQTLMNLPVEPETSIWCQVARDLLKRAHAIVIPPANRQFRPPLAAPAVAVSQPNLLPSLPSPATQNVSGAPNRPSVMPFKNFLTETGTGKHLGGWMEQISSTTQILGQRVKQEWEQIAAATNPESHQIYLQNHPTTPSSTRVADSTGAYNISYRAVGREPPLFDPPIPAPSQQQPPAPRPLTRNAICKRLDHSTAVLHAFLVQQQNEQQTTSIPPEVWQAIVDLQTMSRELRPRGSYS